MNAGLFVSDVVAREEIKQAQAYLLAFVGRRNCLP
jgi:hypothetical protein